MPTISTSTPLSAPSEVMASTVKPSPTLTFIDLASPVADERLNLARGLRIEVAP